MFLWTNCGVGLRENDNGEEVLYEVGDDEVLASGLGVGVGKEINGKFKIGRMI